MFCCEKEAAVSPGDGLFPPDETAFETPKYLVRAVTEYPDHLEAAAEAAAGRDDFQNGE